MPRLGRRQGGLSTRAANVCACLVLAAFCGLTTSMPARKTAKAASPTGPSRVQDPVKRVQPQVSVATLARNLAIPWGVAFLPDGGALVTERLTRRIVKVGPDKQANGELVTTEVAVIDEVYADNERGLLGIAASPDFATDNTVYIHYTTKEDNRIARLKLGEKPEPIVTGIPVAGLLDGGRLVFGPDGYLYAATGDATRGQDAQSLESLGGKILRMTTDGQPAPGNPFPDSLIWSYGHRNPEGIAWDSAGRMFVAEIGESVWDELNVVDRGGNYGWPEVEGIGNDPQYIDPIVAWHPEAGVSAGVAIMGDVAVVTCLRGQRIYLVKLDEGRVGAVGNSAAEGGEGTATPNMRWRPDAGVAGTPEEALVGEYGRLRTAITAPDGSVWLTTSNKDGRNPNGIAIDDDRILQLNL